MFCRLPLCISLLQGTVERFLNFIYICVTSTHTDKVNSVSLSVNCFHGYPLIAVFVIGRHYFFVDGIKFRTFFSFT